MSRILTFIDTFIERPTAPDTAKVLVVCAAYVVGIGGWYRMVMEAATRSTPPEVGLNGVALGLLLLVVIAGLILLLGSVVDRPGLERVANILVWLVCFVLGYSLWLAFLGLMYGLYQMVWPMVVAWAG